MTALVERIVQKFTEVAPIESAVSVFVAGVLENTATRLSGGAPLEIADEGRTEEAAA